MLFQILGIGIAGPLFFFLFWISTPINSFRAADHRLTDTRYTYTVLPMVLLFSVVPIYLAYYSPTLQQRHWHMWAWQMFPLSISIGQYLLSKAIPNTMKQDRLKNFKRDMPAIRMTVGAMAMLSAGVWIYTLTKSPFTFSEMFVPGTSPANDFGGQSGFILRWDQICGSGASLLWLMYSFIDLKRAGMADMSYINAIALMSTSLICFGPGATFALGWLFREETLLAKRHKSAVTRENLIKQGKAHLLASGSNDKLVNGNGHKAANGSHKIAAGQKADYEFDLVH
jgi:hypothetical protein